METENKCTICNRYFEYRYRYWKFDDTPEGLKEVEMLTSHTHCRLRYKQLLEEKLELEWKLYLLQNNHLFEE